MTGSWTWVGVHMERFAGGTSHSIRSSDANFTAHSPSTSSELLTPMRLRIGSLCGGTYGALAPYGEARQPARSPERRSFEIWAGNKRSKLGFAESVLPAPILAKKPMSAVPSSAREGGQHQKSVPSAKSGPRAPGVAQVRAVSAYARPRFQTTPAPDFGSSMDDPLTDLLPRTPRASPQTHPT